MKFYQFHVFVESFEIILMELLCGVTGLKFVSSKSLEKLIFLLLELKNLSSIDETFSQNIEMNKSTSIRARIRVTQ